MLKSVHLKKLSNVSLFIEVNCLHLYVPTNRNRTLYMPISSSDILSSQQEQWLSLAIRRGKCPLFYRHTWPTIHTESSGQLSFWGEAAMLGSSYLTDSLGNSIQQKMWRISRWQNCQRFTPCVMVSCSMSAQHPWGTSDHRAQTALYTSGNFLSLSSLTYSTYCQWPTKWG